MCPTLRVKQNSGVCSTARVSPSRCTHNLVVSATSFHERDAEFADSYERPDKNA